MPRHNHHKGEIHAELYVRRMPVRHDRQF